MRETQVIKITIHIDLSCLSNMNSLFSKSYKLNIRRRRPVATYIKLEAIVTVSRAYIINYRASHMSCVYAFEDMRLCVNTFDMISNYSWLFVLLKLYKCNLVLNSHWLIVFLCMCLCVCVNAFVFMRMCLFVWVYAFVVMRLRSYVWYETSEALVIV